MVIEANNADTLFDLVCLKLANSNCREEAIKNGMAKELINVNLVLTDPTRNTMLECGRKMSLRYALGELLWYNSRNNKASSIAKFSKFWTNIANKDGTINSNYGYCIHDKFKFDQWKYVVDLLKKDPGSRQAVIHIKEARDLLKHPCKDVNCTIALQFFVNDGKLDMIVTMRSNDIWLGLPYDLFNFTCMQIQMAMELGIEIGTYYHNAASLHLYARDLDKFNKIFSQGKS